jgi:Zn ribbon nucleic-acid-binding protein
MPRLNLCPTCNGQMFKDDDDITILKCVQCGRTNAPPPPSLRIVRESKLPGKGHLRGEIKEAS